MEERSKEEKPKEKEKRKGFKSKKESADTKATPSKKGGIFKTPLVAPKAPAASNESGAT
jgi:hypothetical protein